MPNQKNWKCWPLVFGLMSAVAVAQEADLKKAAEQNKQAVTAVETAGVSFPKVALIQDRPLKLVGTGVREKFFIDLYAVGLYTENGQAPNLLADNSAYALRLHILSSMVTAKKMAEATKEGFEHSTKGNTDPIANDIQTLITAFKDEIEEGDEFDLVYTPDEGVQVLKNGKPKIAAIVGEEFKRALFGIWLSKEAVQEDLRDALLAKQ